MNGSSCARLYWSVLDLRSDFRSLPVCFKESNKKSKVTSQFLVIFLVTNLLCSVDTRCVCLSYDTSLSIIHYSTLLHHDRPVLITVTKEFVNGIIDEQYLMIVNHLTQSYRSASVIANYNRRGYRVDVSNLNFPEWRSTPPYFFHEALVLALTSTLTSASISL